MTGSVSEKERTFRAELARLGADVSGLNGGVVEDAVKLVESVEAPSSWGRLLQIFGAHLVAMRLPGANKERHRQGASDAMQQLIARGADETALRMLSRSIAEHMTGE